MSLFIDASAVVALLRPEPTAGELAARMDAHGGPFFISAIVRFETAMALARSKTPLPSPIQPAAVAKANAAVDRFVQDLGISEVLISAEVGRLAIEAARSYGKGVDSPAQLNMGDCFSYACCKAYHLALLYTGQDFTKTDIG
ncbi:MULTISPECIES: type II toxin-antitoxin system VapC family toxin [unclassified Mesorhizobium]|uniref:type II toxin-antitoxin system VapC family toxin n=1 Tax=unclassified Mesorhizobium TaxID=325217 RepID=UPI001CCBE46F|nr:MULTISPECIES: type II toxin-antitoxin system VapC family toxin [unclassified Mesorhizobium]MBZ9680989.1 type II toxin-antitoxin system VapC family toxin [Mesorhizobium sp. CO1-1-2]MBZ9927087.1 type II toxin-antitoxin system VapC family toxin [Mesorhizobium sp. BR1-1-4]